LACANLRQKQNKIRRTRHAPRRRQRLPDRERCRNGNGRIAASARALQRGEAPPHLQYQDRYTVRSGACVTSKTKDLTAVMIERFGDPAGFVGHSGRNAAAE